MKKAGLFLGDHDIQQWIGKLLRYGVLLACIVSIIGGFLYLIQFGKGVPNYHVFIGESPEYTTLPAILKGLLTFKAGEIIQFGVIILIATPILRIVLSLIAFIIEKDIAYILISAVVLAIILISMLGGFKI